VPPEVEAGLRRDLTALPAGPAMAAPRDVAARRPAGIEVQIIQKDTRATAISLGHPIAVTRSHPDFAALMVARTWLGEHRSSMSHLYQRIREVRGMNYGDYAYIEAFPGGMYRSLPEANVARRAQLFEIWIRPVLPRNAHMALRIAVHELAKLIDNGLTEEQFQATREYLAKNVHLVTATQDAQLGYALDSSWYGIGEYGQYLKDRLAGLKLEDVNRAIKKHLSAKDLAVVMITQDAAGLREALVADGFSAIEYDAPKPQDLLDEDKVIGALRIGIRPEAVTIRPVEEVFRQ